MTDQTPTTDIGPDPWTEFPAGSDEPVPGDVSTPEMTDDEAVDANFADAYAKANAEFVPATEGEAIERGGVLLASIGSADPGQVRVFVYVVDDQAAAYVCGDLVTNAPVAETPRLLHRAVKVFNSRNAEA